MYYLFEVFGIDFNIGALISFLVGIMAGFMIMFLVYIYAVIKSLNRKMRIKKADENDIDEEEIRILIKDAQNEYKNKELKKELGYVKHITNICKDLSMDISKMFFPKSRYPFLEMTLEETFKIGHYVIDRLNEVLDAKIVRMFKGMTLKQIASLNDAKKTIENNKYIKNETLQKVYKATMHTLNAINPVYWFRKAVMDNIVKIIMNKMALAAIQIVGEETYKIYSKKVFELGEDEIDVDKFYQDIEHEMKEVKKHEEETEN